MQIDMHYYGTYAMALAAGLRPDICHDIANASQFVDDNATPDRIVFTGGSQFQTTATAHTLTQVQNFEDEDQRQVWLPFHFIPGNQGDTLFDRLVCQTDSLIARNVVENALHHAQSPFAVQMMGVVAHCYADTFSHYGFSGISAQTNRIEYDSIELDQDLDPDISDYLLAKAKKFFGKGFVKAISHFGSIEAEAAEQITGGLGHASVATYPDRPYLKWSFRYLNSDTITTRDNPATFLAGCEALHGVFRRFAALRPDLTSGSGVDFSSITDQVQAVLAVQKECQGRCDAWKNAALDKAFDKTGSDIVDYSAEQWLGWAKSIEGGDVPADLQHHPFFKFHQAALHHRNYVLHVLLPSQSLFVS